MTVIQHLKHNSFFNILNPIIHFSFDTAGAKEKFTKENAEKEISPSAEGEEGVAPPPHKLLKKFDQNFAALRQ